MEQVEQYQPPPNFVKEADARPGDEEEAASVGKGSSASVLAGNAATSAKDLVEE
jgi:hypothetical protein